MHYEDLFFIEDAPMYYTIIANDRTYVNGEYVKEIDYSTWNRIEKSTEYSQDKDSIFYYSDEIARKNPYKRSKFKIVEIESTNTDYTGLVNFGHNGNFGLLKNYFHCIL